MNSFFLDLLWDIGFQTMEYITSESSGILTAVIMINGSNVTSPFNITIQAVNGTAIGKKNIRSSVPAFHNIM